MMNRSLRISLLVIVITCIICGCDARNRNTVWNDCKTALENIQTQTSIQTEEKITMTYPEGDVVQTIMRWYADGDCLYICQQAGTTEFCYLFYNNTLYQKNPGAQNWIKSDRTVNIAPWHLNWDTSNNKVISWEYTEDEIIVICDNLPNEDLTSGIMEYSSSIITYRFDQEWGLKSYEVHSEFINEGDNGAADKMTITVSVVLNTASKSVIRSTIDNAYAQVENNMQ